MEVFIHFALPKGFRLRQQFESEIDPKLQAVLLGCALYSYQHWGIQWVITSLIRTPEENEALGGRKNSSHLDGRAADNRSRNFTVEQITQLENYVKDTWGPMVHFVHHDSGHGQHIHININRPYASKEWNTA